MGWIESPAYFYVTSETGRDVAEQYIQTPVGSLESHSFGHHATQGDEYKNFVDLHEQGQLSYMLEFYMGNYVALALPTTRAQLKHVSTAIMTGIHDVFPEYDDDERGHLTKEAQDT